jgi:hypothetical protein
MTEYERRALREHAEHHYGERHLPDWVKVTIGLVLGLPILWVYVVILLSL